MNHYESLAFLQILPNFITLNFFSKGSSLFRSEVCFRFLFFLNGRGSEPIRSGFLQTFPQAPEFGQKKNGDALAVVGPQENMQSGHFGCQFVTLKPEKPSEKTSQTKQPVKTLGLGDPFKIDLKDLS